MAEVTGNVKYKFIYFLFVDFTFITAVKYYAV